MELLENLLACLVKMINDYENILINNFTTETLQETRQAIRQTQIFINDLKELGITSYELGE